MEYEVVKGHDGREYAKFDSEYDVDQYCLRHGIDPTPHCCNGYMNAILLDDVVTE